MSHVYVLSERVKNMLQTKGLMLVCERCGKPIMPGETVTSKISRGKVKRFYHKDCFKSLFV